MLVLWYQSKSVLSKLIRTVTRSPYSHVAIAVGTPDGPIVYEAIGRGIVKHEGDEAWTRINESIAQKYIPVHENDLKRVQFWLEHRVGRHYSYVGFVAAGVAAITGFKVVVAWENTYICSGLVATALQIAGYIPFSDTRLETPQSLAHKLEPNDKPEENQIPWVIHRGGESGD